MCTQWQGKHQRYSRTGRVQKNHNILRKNTIFNEHPIQYGIPMIELPFLIIRILVVAVPRLLEAWQSYRPNEELRTWIKARDKTKQTYVLQINISINLSIKNTNINISTNKFACPSVKSAPMAPRNICSNICTECFEVMHSTSLTIFLP